MTWNHRQHSQTLLFAIPRVGIQPFAISPSLKIVQLLNETVIHHQHIYDLHKKPSLKNYSAIAIRTSGDSPMCGRRRHGRGSIVSTMEGGKLVSAEGRTPRSTSLRVAYLNSQYSNLAPASAPYFGTLILQNN